MHCLKESCSIIFFVEIDPKKREYFCVKCREMEKKKNFVAFGKLVEIIVSREKIYRDAFL